VKDLPDSEIPYKRVGSLSLKPVEGEFPASHSKHLTLNKYVNTFRR